MHQPLLKSALWALSGVMLHHAGHPPHRDVSAQDDCPDEGLLRTAIFRYGTSAYSCLTGYITIAEIATIHYSSFLEPNPAAVDAYFAASFAVLCASFLLRVYCFRALGDLFTTVVAIRPNHQLITHGPYGFVRHPSYTAAFGIFAGTTMLQLSGASGGIVKWAGWLRVLLLLVVCSQLFSRSKREDEVLSKRFGGEWGAYRGRVSCRFLPGII